MIFHNRHSYIFYEQDWSAIPGAHLSGGSLCDLVVLPSDSVFPCPVGVDLTGSVTVPYSGLLALDCLRRRCNLLLSEDDEDASTRSVLVVHATSASGVMLLQMLRSRCRGVRVTAAANYRSIPLAKMLGAHLAVDMDRIREELLPGSHSFDAILVAGSGRSDDEDTTYYRQMLSEGGRLVFVTEEDLDAGPPALLSRLFLRPLTSLLWPCGTGCRVHLSELDTLREMIESGELKPVRDLSFRLEQVSDAFRHIAGPDGAVGKTIIVLR